MAEGTYPDLQIHINDDKYESDISKYKCDPELDSFLKANVIEVNNEKAKIQICINEFAEDLLESFSEYNNLIFERESNTYEFYAKDFDRCLLSEDMFTDEVKEEIVKGMIQQIQEEFEEINSSNEELNSIMEGFGGNNPENQIEVTTFDTNLKNTELYIVVPTENINFEISGGDLMRHALYYDDCNITWRRYTGVLGVEGVFAVIENDDGDKFVECAYPVISPDGSLNKEKTTYKGIGSYDYVIQVHDSIEGCIEYFCHFSEQMEYEIIKVEPYTE